MLQLAEFQARFSRAIETGEMAHLDGELREGALSVREGMEIYRANALGAAATALTISYPTVVRLVGSAFFMRLAHQFAQANPPRSGCLSRYGFEFPVFLERAPALEALPYIADVARLDRALDEVGNALLGQRSRRFSLGGTRIELDRTLAVLDLDWPADDIRAAIEIDDKELTRIDMRRGPRWRAMWRTPRGVQMRSLTQASCAFVRGLLSGRRAQTAIALALAINPDGGLADIERDVLRAPFARVTAQSGAAS